MAVNDYESVEAHPNGLAQRSKMKKRTLVIVALFLLMATLTGWVQVAASAPAPPTPTPVSTPTPPAETVPLTTEQAALVVGPGQLGRLSLQLNAGDRVNGQVTAVPQDIYFTIEDPHGQIVLNAGRITEKDFSFVAATRGSYQLVFGNALFLLSNKVVLVQLQHTGAQVFPPFTGTYVAVSPGEVKTFTVVLTANQELKGSLKIQGGQQELGFSVSDPNGNTVVSAGKVYYSQTFAFTAATSGAYQLCFDNSFSSYASKLVSIELFTNPGGQWRWWGAPRQWWGSPPKLSFTTSPAGAISGSGFTTQPVVKVQDGGSNITTPSSAAVTVTITPGTGTSGAVLSGTTTVSALNGVATFSGLSIDLPGAAYTLTATSNGVTSAVSSAFNVTLPANMIVLNAGWSLISLPLIPGNPAITSVLSGISSSVISVWHYDGASASWLNYVPALGGTLTTMRDGNAYWINMGAPTILNVSGSELPARPAPPPTYSVAAGWNMIGFKSMASRSLAAYLTGTDYRGFPIYGYAPGACLTISSSTDSLQLGMGYWVYFNAAGIIRP